MQIRYIKASLATMITIYLGEIFNIDSLFFATIAAVISSQISHIDTVIVGKKRIFGTILGATVGMIFASLFKSNILIIGIGIYSIIYISDNIIKSSAANVACIVFLAIMLNYGNKTPFIYALNRLIDTSFGIIITIIVSMSLSLINKKYKIFKK
ncbi:fusaric acid resistance family protein [Hypnocyclicus thermotrophus]|uniref:Fusaric acid resistance family protein n=1 Tax=Hypnocyclicus thermotrophus TaxID=1627895 RepID=A0AA46E055_9FUSO|nr:FUSC family protein [Hypnocyclicus thermotrophus]TDT72344.1 fusaric acid resistance family protein [Hypnocyclicus thermotrophus]